MSYIPAQTPTIETLDELIEYVHDELLSIAQEFGGIDVLQLNPLGQPPVRPRDGMVAFADGVWDPGWSRGPYVFEFGVWVPMVNKVNAPHLVTTPTYTVALKDNVVIINNAVTTTITLADPAVLPGRMIRFKTIQNVLVQSATANVIPLQGLTPGTVIIPASGKNTWVDLVAAGPDWIATAGA